MGCWSCPAKAGCTAAGVWVLFSSGEPPPLAGCPFCGALLTWRGWAEGLDDPRHRPGRKRTGGRN
jgi:hypothetical protein